MSTDHLPCFLLLLCTFFLGIHGGEPGFSLSCPTPVCNGIRISYPFWLIDDGSATNRPKQNLYCGYPWFGLSCPESNNTGPILALLDNSYYVKNIDYSTHSITLVDVDVVGIRKHCPRLQHNVTIETLLLAYNRDDVNITFYFNCSFGEAKLPPVRPIKCLANSGKSSYVIMDGGQAAVSFNWTGKCEEVVVTAVHREMIGSESDLMDRFIEVMNSGFILDYRFIKAINSGFVLDWSRAKECGGCESTGGQCGFNNRTKEDFCFCDDGSIHRNLSNTYCRGESKVPLKVGIGVAAGGGTALILVSIFLFHWHCSRRRSGHSYEVSRSNSLAFSSRMDFEKGGQYCGLPIFDYEELREATNNFDPKKELGDGGFGTVFYGKLRDGREVAVKRLYENNYKRVERFVNEVEILARLRHPNLVTLYGCTSRQSHRLLLVYEYMPNGTVADHLHGDRAKPGSLPWCTRLNIAVETASALVYLHTTDIVHRDVKTNNILLDENFSVKVADFGLSRLFPLNATHVSTAPQGTPGYLDPEYHQCYKLTEKSDVYSFGVVLMELISSLPAVDITRHGNEINLSTMAINKMHNHKLHDLVDPNLRFDSDCDARKTITAVAELGFRCLQNAKDTRPSMTEVLQTLKDIQKQDSDEDKNIAEENDNASLLNADQSKDSKLSPVSVMAKFASTATTPNVSG